MQMTLPQRMRARMSPTATKTKQLMGSVESLSVLKSIEVEVAKEVGNFEFQLKELLLAIDPAVKEVTLDYLIGDDWEVEGELDRKTNEIYINTGQVPVTVDAIVTYADGTRVTSDTKMYVKYDIFGLVFPKNVARVLFTPLTHGRDENHDR